MKVKIIDLISFVFIACIILIPIAIPWTIIGFILYIARDMTYGLFIRSFIDSNYDGGEYILMAQSIHAHGLGFHARNKAQREAVFKDTEKSNDRYLTVNVFKLKPLKGGTMLQFYTQSETT